MLALLAHVVVAMTPQRLARGEATTRQEVIAKTTVPLLYALTAVTVAGREAPLAPPLAAVVATTLPAALDLPLVVALALPPPHHGVAARLVAPLLLVVVLEDADSRHF